MQLIFKLYIINILKFKIMKNLIFLFTSFFGAVVAVSNVKAQEINAFATANVTATIVEPIKIVKTMDLYFGNIVVGDGDGTVRIEVDNTRIMTGDIILPIEMPGTISAAQFIVEGSPNVTYSISVPTSLTVVREEGNETMIVDNIITIPESTGTLSENGTQIIKVGATLHVNANQVIGIYKNENGIAITIAYQ